MSASFLGRRLAAFLNAPNPRYVTYAPTDLAKMAAVLRPGDVILVEGDRRISSAIKYLTQSSWSHAALYVGPQSQLGSAPSGEPRVAVEADVEEGVIGVPLSLYKGLNMRICRAHNLTEADAGTVVDCALSHLGNKYDLKNIVDLARYLLPNPPVPTRFRRRMLALGSGEPTRAICSTLVAQCFDAVKYPILPRIESTFVTDANTRAEMQREILHIRHFSLYVPRDFDVSPYFEVVKPTIEAGFDYKQVVWAEQIGPLKQSPP